MAGSMKSDIPFIVPEFPTATEVARDYEAILQNSWFTNFGPFEHELCQKVSQFIDQGVFVATVANATLGLLLAAKELLGSPTATKTEVLMPAFTFPAGAEALIWCGFRPVFIDIEPGSLQPDIHKAQRYLDQNPANVAGILLCNVLGVGAGNLDEWEQLSHQAKLPLIIDSAAGFGSTYPDGTKLGYRGDCEIFSLHATKPFSVGEGGLVVSRSQPFINKLRQLENFGFDNTRTVRGLGINAKLAELNCAIAIRQLAKLESMIAGRQRRLSQYKQELTNKGFQFQANDQHATNPFITALAPTKEAASYYLNALNTNGVEVRNYYNPPLHQQSGLTQFTKTSDELPITQDVCQRVISLPAHGKLDTEAIKFICSLAPGTD